MSHRRTSAQAGGHVPDFRWRRNAGRELRIAHTFDARGGIELDLDSGPGTHEDAGLLTTYGGVSMAGPDSNGVRLGGRIELGEWIDLSVEGERTTQGGSAEHQVALYGRLGW